MADDDREEAAGDPEAAARVGRDRGDRAGDFFEIRAGRAEDGDPRFGRVGDEDLAARADRDRVGEAEGLAEFFDFGRLGAVAAEFFDEGARGGEDLDAAVAAIDRVDVAGGSDRDADNFVQLAFAAAREAGLTGGFADLQVARAVFDSPAEGADEGAFTAELVDPVVGRVGDVDVAGRAVDGNAARLAQLAGRTAGAAERAGFDLFGGPRRRR